MKRKNQKLRFSWPMCLGLVSCCMIVGCTLENPVNADLKHCGEDEEGNPVNCINMINHNGVLDVVCHTNKQAPPYESKDFYCMITECNAKDNFILDKNKNSCEKKSELCDKSKCESLDGWFDGICVNLQGTDTCVATACDDKHFIIRTGTSNNENVRVLLGCQGSDTSNCGSLGVSCKKNEQAWLDGDCLHNQCVATKCDKYYYVNDGKCVLVDPMNCGEKNKRCKDGEICDLENGKCIFKCEAPNVECTSDNTRSCVNTNNGSPEHCGSCNNACSLKAHAQSMTCVKGKCKISQCETGYHLYEQDDICEMDSFYHCGEHDLRCKTQEEVCKSSKAPLPYKEEDVSDEELIDNGGTAVYHGHDVDNQAVCILSDQICYNGQCINDGLFSANEVVYEGTVEAAEHQMEASENTPKSP